MDNSIGRGFLGSLRKRVRQEVSEQQRSNSTLRLARYGFARTAICQCVGGRAIAWFALIYALIDIMAVLAEAILNKYWCGRLPDWVSPVLAGRLKDISGFLITAQVGLLAIVSVAIGVVTLISQRDDGSSTNTDVRLYYSETLAYEVVASSASLLVALALQEFWPLQFLLHQAGWGGNDQVFKLGLTVVHILWLAFNTILFGQFLATTLRFVEPNARTLMRERYTANVIAPSNNFTRLIRFLYQTAPSEMFKRQPNNMESPYITFGYGLIGDEGKVEIETNFTTPHNLHDVLMRPLSFVLRRWEARTKAMPDQHGPRNVLGRRLVQLVIRPDFDGRYEGLFGWVVRLGGAEFAPWELWVIRRCFRFKPIRRKGVELPTPSNLLEELFDKVLGQIERLAETSFRSALLEAADYHRFLIAIHDSKDAQGRPLNFAQLGGFQGQYQEWIRLYRRVIEKAVEKIDSDDYFISHLSHIIIRLIPNNAREVATPVVTSLLDIGVHEVVLLEAWFTKKSSTAPTEGHALAGSTQSAYERVILDFVGAWESVSKSTSSFYDWSGAKREGNEAYWSVLTQSWPFMQRHLHNTAHFLALAIWNEDAIGTAGHRDMLVRWPDAFRFNNHGEYTTRRKEVLGSDLFTLNWHQVSNRLQPFKRHENSNDLNPEEVVSLALRNVHGDVILVTAAISLRWHMQDTSDIAATAASALVRRQVSDDDGARLADPLPPIDVYSSVWGLFLRSASGIYGDGMHHRAELDGLVRTMSQMAERRMISGRIYSSVGSDGIESIYPQLCAILAALLPAGGDEQTEAWFREVAEAPNFLEGGDKGLQRLLDRIRVLQNSLANVQGTDAFARGVQAINPNADPVPVAKRLDAVIGRAIDIINDVRDRRLVEAPYDPAKIERLRSKLENVIMQHGMVMSCFRGFDQVQSDQRMDQEQFLRVNGVDKSDFITPSMSLDPNSGWEDMVADRFSEAIGGAVWRSLWRIAWTDVATDAFLGSPEYWELVDSEKVGVGAEPALLAPQAVGNVITSWMYGQRNEIPPGLTVTHRDGRNSGLGAGYRGTVDDVDVFSMNFLPNDSRLVSSLLLQTVVYHPLKTGRLVEIEFADGDDPKRPTLTVRYALKAVWHRNRAVRILSGGWDGAEPKPEDDDE